MKVIYLIKIVGGLKGGDESQYDIFEEVKEVQILQFFDTFSLCEEGGNFGLFN